jgi:hypothetical protein
VVASQATPSTAFITIASLADDKTFRRRASKGDSETESAVAAATDVYSM